MNNTKHFLALYSTMKWVAMQATEMVVGQAKIVTGGFAIDLS
jgi:hypothetical protein